MRPYIAVISDSFREALASRVLWFIFIAIGVFLVVLFPVGVRDEVTASFKWMDIVNNQRLVRLLAEAGESRTDTPAKHVFEALSGQFKDQIASQAQPGGRGVGSWKAADELNALLKSDEWHDDKLWETTTRLSELRRLDETQSISEELRRRRARLRIESALPGVFQPRSGDSVRLQYATIDFPDSFVVSRPMFHEFLGKFIIPAFVSLLLGMVGIFIAILITAPIVPEMFQTGSLQLLLSKPIARPLLFIAKYVGGCCFVLLNISLFVVGIWLIAGMRLEHWNHRILLCIPFFVFLFLVYFSVSAVSGLIWRNAIVSIAATVVFFIASFLVVLADGIFQEQVLKPARIAGMAELNGDLFSVSRDGQLTRFEQGSSTPQDLFEKEFGGRYRLLGPVVLQASEKIVIAPVRRRDFNFFADSNVSLQIFSSENDWKPVEGCKVPAGTNRLMATADDSVIAFGASGIYRAAANQLEKVPMKQSGGFLDGLLSFLPKSKGQSFVQVTPSALTINSPMSAAISKEQGLLFIYTRGELVKLKISSSGDFEIVCRVTLEGEATQRAALATSGERIVLAREDSGIEIYGTSSLELKGEVEALTDSTPRMLSGCQSDNSLVSVIYSNGTAGVLDCEQSDWSAFDMPHQGDIGYALWGADGMLNLAHSIDQVASCNVEENQVTAEITPPLDYWRTIYRYIVRPIRFVFPRPLEFIDAIHGVVIGENEIVAGPPMQESMQTDLNYDREQIDTWWPFVSCSFFTVAVLCFGCVYISRQDF